MAFLIWHKISVKVYQFFDGEQEKIGGKFGHAHPPGTVVEAHGVHFWPEKVWHAIDFGGFHALKNGLAVVERDIAGRDLHVLIRGNARVDPIHTVKIHHEHMVGKGFSKRDIIEINFGESGFWGALNSDVPIHCGDIFMDGREAGGAKVAYFRQNSKFFLHIFEIIFFKTQGLPDKDFEYA